MKLTKFAELKMAARRFNIDLVAKTEYILLSQKGLDTDLSDVLVSDNNELLNISKNGEVQRCIAYISERPSYYDERGWAYPKYHIYNCQTMVDMRKNNRAHRYKKTIRSDGQFYMILSKKNGSEEFYKELQLCKNCFQEYIKNYNDISNESNFNIKQYFEKSISNSNFFVDIAEDFTTVPKYYAQNWKNISAQAKKLKNYTCEQCGVRLTGSFQKYLHTHHVNGNKHVNILSNLKVLCIECHAKEYKHSHLKNSSDYKDYMANKGVIYEGQ